MKRATGSGEDSTVIEGAALEVEGEGLIGGGRLIVVTAK